MPDNDLKKHDDPHKIGGFRGIVSILRVPRFNNNVRCITAYRGAV